MEKKERIFRNSARNTVKEQVKPYVPQYQLRGIQPQPFGGSVNIRFKEEEKLPLINPRATRSFSPPSILPNSFLNALENKPDANAKTWSSLDNDIMYDLDDEDNEDGQAVDPNLLDHNNDYYSAKAFGFDSEEELEEAMIKAQKLVNGNSVIVSEEEQRKAFTESLDNQPVSFQNLEDDEYALIINNEIISKGPIEEIQYQVNLILFGGILDTPVDKESITIVKKVKLRVGAFIE